MDPRVFNWQDALQRVVIDGVLSNPTEVLSGVVQGSVLGPLIFILFIDDITDCMDISEVNRAVFLQTILKFIAQMTPFMIIPPLFTL